MIKIYQDSLLKNGLKFMINQKKITVLTKKLEINSVQIDNAEDLDVIMPM